MTRVAVLSDTHGLLRPEVIQIVTGCDAIIHGGDINNQKILDQLSALCRSRQQRQGVGGAFAGEHHHPD